MHTYTTHGGERASDEPQARHAFGRQPHIPMFTKMMLAPSLHPNTHFDPEHRFGISPGCTESPSGSLSSVSSMPSLHSMSFHGDATDVDDDDAEAELNIASKLDEPDDIALAALENDDDTIGDMDGVQSTAASWDATTSHSGSLARSWNNSTVHTPFPLHRSHSVPTQSALLTLRKGRVSELLAECDEMPHTTTPFGSTRLDTCASGGAADFDPDALPLPPTSQPAANATDSVPAVPSPLYQCISANAIDGDPKAEQDCNMRSKQHDNDGGSVHSRGRLRMVRFSTNPPSEIRTHSPVEYDRKACQPNHHFCGKDLEELRALDMPMELLASRWSALKQLVPHCTSDAPLCEDINVENTPKCAPATLDTARTAPLCAQSLRIMPADDTQVAQTRRARWDDMRSSHERRRGRSCSAVPEAKPRDPSCTSLLAPSIAARFGLDKPPPPLPGTPDAADLSPSSPPRSTECLTPPCPEQLCETRVPDMCDGGSEYDFVV